MKITVLGIGNAFTSEHNCTAFLIETDKKYLLDAPPSLFRILYKLGVDKQEINDVIITHDHGDHTGGLEPLFLWKHFVERRKINLYTTRKIFEDIEKSVFSKMDKAFDDSLKNLKTLKFEDIVNFIELTPQKTYEKDGLTIDIRDNWHHCSTIGLKISVNGKSMAYSGDTKYGLEFIKELIDDNKIEESDVYKLTDWLWESDLIFHDAESIVDGIHTYIGELEKLPDATRKKMLLVHLSDSFYSPKIKCAEEYKTYSI